MESLALWALARLLPVYSGENNHLVLSRGGIDDGHIDYLASVANALRLS